MNLVVRPAAAADVDEAFLWYDARRPGLGEEFLAAVGEALQRVRESPRAYGSSIGRPAAHT